MRFTNPGKNGVYKYIHVLDHDNISMKIIMFESGIDIHRLHVSMRNIVIYKLLVFIIKIIKMSHLWLYFQSQRTYKCYNLHIQLDNKNVFGNKFPYRLVANSTTSFIEHAPPMNINHTNVNSIWNIDQVTYCDNDTIIEGNILIDISLINRFNFI